MTQLVHKAVNWDTPTNEYAEMFWLQNTKQVWFPEEIPVSKDVKDWSLMNEDEKDAYAKVLAGLTALDTIQGGSGMPLLSLMMDDLQVKAVFTFQAAMEQVHARSYSTIFTTLLNKSKIDGYFKWVEKNELLQRKAELFENVYGSLDKQNPLSVYKGLVASVALETGAFYSGFYYPLLLKGQGRMTSSGEIIKLIIRDESIHGIFTGLIAQDIYKNLAPNEQLEADEFTADFFANLYDIEKLYTNEVYEKIGLAHDVRKFVRYNMNKALQNLGQTDMMFEEEDVNPVVMNGLSTDSTTHDFFSQKGNGYQKGKVEELRDEDFNFDWLT